MLNLGVILEVATGLIFVFLLLSLASMQIREIFSSFFNLRAKHLEDAIRHMLSGTDDKYVKLIYEHPLLQNLKKKQGKLEGWLIQKSNKGLGKLKWINRLLMRLIGFLENKRKTDTIAPEKFALALFDMVMTAGTDKSTIMEALVNLQKDLPETIKEKVNSGIKSLIAEINKKDDETELIEWESTFDSILKEYPALKTLLNIQLQSQLADNDQALGLVVNGATKLIFDNPQLSETLHHLVTQAKKYGKEADKSLAAVCTNAETWFNESMVQLGKWYKSTSQVWVVIVGLILAFALNIDTIQIADTLWREPTLRQTIVAQAEVYEMPTPEPGDTKPEEAIEEAGEKIRDLGDTLTSELGLPVGWRREKMVGKSCPGKDASEKGQVLGWKINDYCWIPNSQASNWGIWAVGCIISGLTPALGAPFWFDLLRKISTLRGKKTKDEDELKISVESPTS